MDRNSYIWNKGLKTYFIASVLISLITQINTFIDGVIVSHLVSPDALSALNLATPVTSLLYAFAGVIGMGVSILIAKELGKQNYPKVSKLFTSGTVIAVAVTAVASAFLLAISDNVAGVLTKEARLLPFLEDYLPFTFIGSIFVTLGFIMMSFVKSTGRPRLATGAVIISTFSNIVMDVVSIKVFEMGISGAALATALSYFFACLYMTCYMARDHTIANWAKPEKSWFLPYSKEIILTGAPAAVKAISTAAFIVALNTLVQKSQGADGMFVMSVSTQMLMICTLVLEGAASSITGIGGVMLGERDLDAYRNLVVGILKKSALTLAIFTICLMMVPDLLAKLFGASEDMVSYAHYPLRICCLFLLPAGLIMITSSSFLLQGHHALASFMSIMYLSVIIPVIWIATEFCSEYFWYSLPLGFWLRMVITVGCSFVLSRKNRNLNWFTLIPKYPDDPGVSLSVAYEREAVDEAMETIHKFINICELQENLHRKVNGCVEALADNILSMAENTGMKGWFDIRATDCGDKLVITMKYDGKPYNPIQTLNGFCSQLNYKYLNGINCVYMNFHCNDDRIN